MCGSKFAERVSCLCGHIGFSKYTYIYIHTYGFVDINFNTELSSVKHKAGSFYFFIPLVSFLAFCLAFYVANSFLFLVNNLSLNIL